MVRPEQIRLLGRSATEDRPSSPECAPAATVLDRTYLGPETVVRLSLDTVDEPVLARVHSHEAPEVGELVSLEVSGPVVVYPAEGSSRRWTADSRLALRWLAVPVGMALAASLLAACGGGGSDDAITLYNGQHPQLTQALVDAFEKQTGIHVRVRTDDGIVLADEILQEGSTRRPTST